MGRKGGENYFWKRLVKRKTDCRGVDWYIYVELGCTRRGAMSAAR